MKLSCVEGGYSSACGGSNEESAAGICVKKDTLAAVCGLSQCGLELF